MQDIMLFGIQGSGKGTQAKILVQKFGYSLFETGGELRKLASSESPLGEKIKNILNSGALVDTPIIMEIVENFLQTVPAGKAIIFDGIPRSEEQRMLFEAVMKKHNKLPLGVHITLSKAEALARLTKRFTCVGVDTTNNPLITEEECIALGGKVIRRSDDTPEAIEVRFSNYAKETEPVIRTYQEEGRMISVVGSKSVEEVTAELIEQLGLK